MTTWTLQSLAMSSVVWIGLSGPTIAQDANPADRPPASQQQEQLAEVVAKKVVQKLAEKPLPVAVTSLDDALKKPGFREELRGGRLIRYGVTAGVALAVHAPHTPNRQKQLATGGFPFGDGPQHFEDTIDAKRHSMVADSRFHFGSRRSRRKLLHCLPAATEGARRGREAASRG
jgi:hypothetical protein